MTSLSADPYASLDNYWGNQYGIPPSILEAQQWAESAWNPQATSSSGAEGLAQFEPGTAASMGISNPYDPNQAVPGEARYMAQLAAQEHGSIPLALAAYNAGPGAVAAAGGIPQNGQTPGYVSSILSDASSGTTGGSGSGVSTSSFNWAVPGTWVGPAWGGISSAWGSIASGVGGAVSKNITHTLLYAAFLLGGVGLTVVGAVKTASPGISMKEIQSRVSPPGLGGSGSAGGSGDSTGDEADLGDLAAF